MRKRLKILDYPVFFISLAVIVTVMLFLLLAPEQSKVIVDWLLHFMTYNLGFLYIISYIVVVLFLIWLAFSKETLINSAIPV